MIACSSPLWAVEARIQRDGKFSSTRWSHHNHTTYCFRLGDAIIHLGRLIKGN
ncbi:hypothetical protein K469DRAFT_708072, partial [Zopfia rhizophila CBS 207.26]